GHLVLFLVLADRLQEPFCDRVDVPDWQPRRDAVHEGGVRRCQHAQAQPRDAERLADALNYREIGMALEVVATQETAPRPAIYKVHERLIEDQDGPECSQGV